MSFNSVTPYPRARFIFGRHHYQWSGWFGCQLESWEWRMPALGTTRELDFGVGKPLITITVFTAVREGLKVRTTWAVSKSGTHDEQNERIHELRNALRSIF